MQLYNSTKKKDIFVLCQRRLVFSGNSMFAIALIVLVCIAIPHSAHSEGYEEQLEEVAKTLAEKIDKAGKTTVAAVDFTDLQGNITELGRFIAEEISTNLVLIDKKFSVIDRVHLRNILSEQKLSVSGLLNPKNAKKLGQIAGVDALIIGSITPFGENIRITFKVIATDTANVIAAARTSIAKTGAVEELLAREIAVVPSTSGAGQAGGTIFATRTVGQVAPFQNSFLRVSLLSAALSQDKKKIMLTLNFTNITKKDIRISLWPRSDDKIMIDNLGNEWRATSNAVGIREQFRGRSGTLLTPGQNMKVILIFAPQQEDITSGNIFNFSANLSEAGYGDFSVGFSGIRIK